MDFLEKFFKGDIEVQLARQQVKKLKEKGVKRTDGLRPADQKRLVQLEEITRRHAIGLVIKGFIAAAVGGGVIAGLVLDDKKEQQESYGPDVSPIKQQRSSLAEKIVKFNKTGSKEEIEAIINKAEAGLKNLQAKIQPQIDEIEESDFKTQLMTPFELVEMNKDNPNKNHTVFLEKYKNNGLQVNTNLLKGTTTFENQNINYYSYDINQDSGVFAATYQPPTRTLFLSSDFNPDNLMDALIFYHELRHVAQDTVARSMLDTREKFNQYMAFAISSTSQKPKVFLNDELTAYAFEVEVLNLLMNRKLDDILSGGLTKEKVLQVAGAIGISSGSQLKRLELLLSIANSYYPDAMKSGLFGEKYVDFVKSKYKRIGYDLFVHTTTGKIMKIN